MKGIAISLIMILVPASMARAQAQTNPIDPTVQWQTGGYTFWGQYGWAVSGAGDFNGDGYSDVVVGTPCINNENAGGEVSMHYGSAQGLAPRSAWGVREEQVDAQMGISVTCAGDINNDGFDDVAVGAPGFRNLHVDEGRVTVYFGRRVFNAFDKWESFGGVFDLRLGQSVCGVGDVNGDGFDDMVAGAPGPGGDGAGGGEILLLAGGDGTPTGYSWMYAAGESGSGFGAAIAGRGDVDGDGYNDVMVAAPEYIVDGVVGGAVYVFFGEPGGLGPAPGIMVTGARDNSGFGETMAMADVNGDGYSDVVVGAAQHRDGGVPEIGRVFVYYSRGPGRALDDPVVLAFGKKRFGYSLGSLGDIDGDGREDIVVGTHNGLNPKVSFREVAFIYMGRSDGIAGDPAQILTRFTPVYPFAAVGAGIGDVNGDGVNDLMIGNPLTDTPYRGEAFVFHGNRIENRLDTEPRGVWRGCSDNDDFGRSVVNAGDVDGDGWDDLLVTARLDDGAAEDAGAAFIYRGAPDGWPTTPSWTLEGRDVGGWFGERAAAIGDVNGDGFADVAIGAPHVGGRVGDEGAAFVYFGGEHGPSPDSSFAGWGGQRGAAMGCDVSWAGDVNGDGLSDILVGSCGYDGEYADEGRIVVYYGNPHRLSETNSWMAGGGQAGAALGHAVSFAGDVDGDGYSDIVAGAPFYDDAWSDEGALFVYHGSATGLPAEPSTVISAGRVGARLGSTLACAGDVNGDGFSDMIAGTGNRTSAMADIGTVFLYYGGPGGASTVSDWGASGYTLDGAFGHALAGLGDINGDGYTEVAVGDPLYDGNEYDCGRVSVFFGGPTGPSTQPGFVLTGQTVRGGLGRAVSSAGDVDGDGGLDILCAARTGDAVKLFTTGATPRARVGRRPVRAGGTEFVAPLGWSGQRERLDLKVDFYPPIGATRVGVECQTRLGGGTWTYPAATGRADVVLLPEERRHGERVSLTVTVPIFRDGDLHEWRVRPTSNHPLHRLSPWYHHASDVSGGLTVRIGEPVDVAPPPDDPPPTAQRPRFEVHHPYPNPFNPHVTVAFSLERASVVTAQIYDVRGSLVMTLLDERREGGPQELHWWGYDRSGVPAVSGVYYLRIRAEGREVIRRLVLVR